MLIQPLINSVAEIHNTSEAKNTATIHVSLILMITSLRLPYFLVIKRDFTGDQYPVCIKGPFHLHPDVIAKIT